MLRTRRTGNLATITMSKLMLTVDIVGLGHRCAPTTTWYGYADSFSNRSGQEGDRDPLRVTEPRR